MVGRDDAGDPKERVVVGGLSNAAVRCGVGQRAVFLRRRQLAEPDEVLGLRLVSPGCTQNW